MKKVLKWLWILQVVSNRNRNPKLGKGFFTAYRLNPLNPLSYVTLVVSVVFGIVLFGIVGVWKEAKSHNPFKWN